MRPAASLDLGKTTNPFNMKKILFPLMALLIHLSAAAQEFTVGDLTYEVTGNGEVCVTACSGSASGSMEIPATVKNNGTEYSVTGIGEDAFWNYGTLTAVTIPVSVTHIAPGAFSNGRALTTIDVEAANGAYGSVDGVLFNKEKTEIVAFPVARTGSYDLPATVTGIGEAAFSNSRGLTAVTMPAALTSIGASAFAGCSGLTAVTLPAALTRIGNYAFNGCSGLTAVALPAALTHLGDYAFYGCSGLTKMMIPAAVTHIGDAAFRDCSGLTAIDVAADNEAYCSVGGVLFNKEKTEVKVYPAGRKGSYDLPDGVTDIGGSAFAGCSGLTAVTMPATVTRIGKEAFTGCGSLAAVTIPATVTYIGGSAFAGCGSLTSVTIPAAVTSIESATFSSCRSLTEVTIPAAVTSIGESAFAGCGGLTTVTIPAAVKSIGAWAFSTCSSLTSIYMESQQPPSTGEGALSYLPYSCTVYVPTGARKAYTAVSPWSTFTIKEYTVSTGIGAVTATSAPVVAYTMDGRPAGRFGSLDEARRQLPAGLYVVNGKKVLVGK